MANVQIPNLPAVVAVSGQELVEAVQGGTSVKVSIEQIGTYIGTTFPVGVTQINTTAPITGGPITSTGSIGIATGGIVNSLLANMAALTIKANTSGVSAAPADRTLSEVLNAMAGTAQGSILFRNSTNWTALPLGSSGQVLTSNGTTAVWDVSPYVGTVTSVNASGGTTGLTFSGGPITTTGTLTLSGTLAVANGGTGGTTQATARSGLGLGTMATQNANSVAITGGSVTGIADIAIADGGTGASTKTAAFNNLSPITSVGDLIIGTGVNTSSRLAIGTSGQVLTSNGTTASWSAPAYTGTVTSVSGSGGTTGLTLTGGPITGSGTLTIGGTLDIAHGGTGQITKAAAFDALSPMTSVGDLILGGTAGTGTRLGVGTIGQVLTSNGTTVVWTNPTSGGTVTSVDVSGGTTGIGFSGGPVTTSGTITMSGTLAVANGGTGATTAAAGFNNLSPITSTGDLIVGNGANSATRLGIGTNGYVLTVSGGTAVWAAPAASGGTVTSVAASGGTTGLTFSGSPITTSGTLTLSGTLAVANGGTGSTTASGARTALGLGTIATQDANNVSITGGSITILDTNLTIQDDVDPTKQLKFQVANLGTGTTVTLTAPTASGTILTVTGSQIVSNKTVDNSNTVTIKDTLFTLQDDADTTKQLQFDASNIATGTTRTLTAPNASGTIAILTLAQTFTSNQTFSNASNSFGTGTGTGTQNFASGVTASGNTKTVNIGTGAASGSTTTITVGPTAGTGTMTFNAGLTSITMPTLTLTSALAVSSGGTGATTLTGYVKGNGTSAMTASATIPNTDITGLGTMSTQAASNVAITGGSIQNTTIGGVGVSAIGTFTTMNATTTLNSLGTTTLGTANTDTVSANGMVYFLGGTRENVYTVTSTTPNFNPNDGGIVQWNLSGNSTPASPTTWLNGQSITLRISDGTAYTINWTTMGVVWVGGTAPTLATTGYTIVVLFKIGGVIYGSLTGNVA